MRVIDPASTVGVQRIGPYKNAPPEYGCFPRAANRGPEGATVTPEGESTTGREARSDSFELLNKMVNDYLLLADPHIVAVVCGALAAHRFKSDPLWLMLVGPPSSAKTELLEGAAGIDSIFRLSDLTPNTFLSGATRKDDRGNEKDPSLLPHLNGRIILTMFLAEIL